MFHFLGLNHISRKGNREMSRSSKPYKLFTSTGVALSLISWLLLYFILCNFSYLGIQLILCYNIQHSSSFVCDFFTKNSPCWWVALFPEAVSDLFVSTFQMPNLSLWINYFGHCLELKRCFVLLLLYSSMPLKWSSTLW